MPGTKKHFIVLFVVTLSLKIVLGVYFSHVTTCQFPDRSFGSVALKTGDTFSYFDPMENVLERGEYFFWNGAREVRAGRMPYYGAAYFLLRLLFDRPVAGDIYVFFQIVFDALATIVFARLCFDVSRRNNAGFWLGYGVYFGSFNFFYLSLMLWTESLSLSFFVFFLYFYHRFWIERSRSNAVAASVLLALAVVLKPYLVLIYAVFLPAVLLRARRFDWSAIWFYLRQTVALSLPLLVLLAPWIARNLVVLERFVPAQENMRAGYNYSGAEIAFADFAGAWGSGAVPWDSSDAGCYFLNQPHCNFTLPTYALTGGYTIEEVERARQNLIELQRNRSSALDEATAAEFNRLTEIYRREQPWMYYVGAKFILLKRLFWHTSNQNLPIQSGYRCYSFGQNVFKILQSGIYVLALALGLFGLLRLGFKRQTGFLFVGVSLLITVFLIEIRTTEMRYLSHVYAVLLIGLTGALLSFGRLRYNSVNFTRSNL